MIIVRANERSCHVWYRSHQSLIRQWAQFQCYDIYDMYMIAAISLVLEDLSRLISTRLWYSLWYCDHRNSRVRMQLLHIWQPLSCTIWSSDSNRTGACSGTWTGTIVVNYSFHSGKNSTRMKDRMLYYDVSGKLGHLCVEISGIIKSWYNFYSPSWLRVPSLFLLVYM